MIVICKLQVEKALKGVMKADAGYNCTTSGGAAGRGVHWDHSDCWFLQTAVEQSKHPSTFTLQRVQMEISTLSSVVIILGTVIFIFWLRNH